MKRKMQDMLIEAEAGMQAQHERGLQLIQLIKNTMHEGAEYDQDDVISCGHKRIISDVIRHPESARWECILHGLLEIIVNDQTTNWPSMKGDA